MELRVPVKRRFAPSGNVPSRAMLASPAGERCLPRQKILAALRGGEETGASASRSRSAAGSPAGSGDPTAYREGSQPGSKAAASSR
jgi:hypothetical protein